MSSTAAEKRVESPSEYTRRILSYAEGKDPLAVLEATPERLRQIVQNTPAAVLRRQPGPGRWSPAQIIAHLADAEIVVGHRMRMIIATNGVDIQAFDQDKWAANLAYESADPGESVDLFEATRVANLRLLRRVDPRLHENYGMHSERGRETVTHMIRLYAGHDLNHLGQIERIVG
jgi:DinB family protein